MAADDAPPRIKSEPLDAPPSAPPLAPPLAPPPPPPHTPSAGAATVAKRDHLRALLDRARANKGLHTRGSGAPPAPALPTPSPSPYVEIKREWSAAPLLPMPGATLAPTPGGLLPTPGSTTTRLTEPQFQYSAHPPVGAANAPADSAYYATAPARLTPDYNPTSSSSSHSFSVSETPASHAALPPALYAESSSHWGYQARFPPSLTIPTLAPFHAVNYTSRANAVPERAATISPSMSATTSSSSSSNTTRRSRAISPSPSSTPTTSKSRRDRSNMKLHPTPTDHPRSGVTATPVHSLDEYEDNDLHSDFVHTVHMLIPAGSFGSLVGHRGERMKEINAASECTLSVRDESSFPMFEADRVLRIYGKPKGICLAQQIVIARIQKYRAEKGDSSYIDIGEELLVPMTKSSVTRTMSQAIESVSDEDDPDEAAERGELRWLVPKNAVGRILGTNGNIQKAIARETNATIHIVPIQNMPPGSSERAVVIKGEPADIKSARSIIEAKAGGRLDSLDANPGKSGQYFVIPQHFTGVLIGPKGTRIRKIREETGASIQIAAQQDLPLGYVNRMLHIQGNTDQIRKARDAVFRSLHSYMRSSEATTAAGEVEIALQLVLPVRICSFLLDQRGWLIREINEKAGAHARFLPPFDDENRVCVLYGDMPKVFRAERLVLQFIAGDAIANKWATAGGAPPRKRKRVDRDEDSELQSISEDLDSDDCTISSTGRVRARKRQAPDSSGRIVHYTLSTKPPANKGSSRHASSSRDNSHAKPNGRGKRRR